MIHGVYLNLTNIDFIIINLVLCTPAQVITTESTPKKYSGSGNGIGTYVYYSNLASCIDSLLTG